jgi:hypothetical protein
MLQQRTRQERWCMVSFYCAVINVCFGFIMLKISFRHLLQWIHSNYGPTLLSRCQETLAKHSVPLASNQIAYSLIGRHNGAQETVDKCNELGIRVLAYYPFAMVRCLLFYC